MTEASPHDKLLRRWKANQDEAAILAMAFIQLELDERTTGLEANYDQAKAARDERVEALREPRAQLAALDEKITVTEQKCSGLREEIGRLADDDDGDDVPDKLAAAKMQLAEWEARVTRLRSKRDFARSGFQPLFEALARAEDWVKLYRGAKYEVAAGIADPFGPLGRGTEAYGMYRAPQLGPVLLQRDEASREWKQALEQLRIWCTYSGHLEPEPDPLRRTPEVMADAAATFDPGPNAQEILAVDKARMENLALENIPSHVDDYRNPRTAVPRMASGRDYMQVPSLRDMGLR